MSDEKHRPPMTNTKQEADDYLSENIEEARKNHGKACEVYRNYVGRAETREERIRRINSFRGGGY